MLAPPLPTTGFYVKATLEPAIEGISLLGERMKEGRAVAVVNEIQNQ
jgi:hypothetical protein